MAVIPATIHAHIETDLADEAIQTLIDAAYADIDGVAGPLTELTKDVICYASRRIHLARPAKSITEIKEGVRIDVLTVVLATDYSLVPGGYVIERHDARWAYYVRVRYIPVQDVARRDGVVIDLVKLALEYKGLISESAGDYSASHVDYTIERNKILSRMTASSRMVV